MQDLAERGVQVRALEGRASPDPALALFWCGFVALSPSRPAGLGVGAIPMSEILAYCELIGVTGTEERALFASIIQRMDAAFLEWLSKKRGVGNNASP